MTVTIVLKEMYVMAIKGQRMNKAHAELEARKLGYFGGYGETLKMLTIFTRRHLFIIGENGLCEVLPSRKALLASQILKLGKIYSL